MTSHTNPNIKYQRFRKLSYFIDLLRSLVDRDMKLTYKRSVLGIVWTLISPLLQLLVFIFVFRSIIKIDIPQYASFVFTGLLIWTWFQSSLFQATGAIVYSAALIRQPGFPTVILPVVMVTNGLIHLMLALPILIIFLLIDGAKFTPLVFLLPLLLLIQFALTVTFSYFLAAINVKFRDTQHTLGVVLQLLFYLSPIFYQLSNVPEKYWDIYKLNPMVHIITAYRKILILGVPPNWHALGIIAIVILIFLPIGYQLFRRQSFQFIEEI